VEQKLEVLLVMDFYLFNHMINLLLLNDGDGDTGWSTQTSPDNLGKNKSVTKFLQ
jgi:hypothetical protein